MAKRTTASDGSATGNEAKRSLLPGSEARAAKIREAQKVIRCGEPGCEAGFEIPGDKFLRSLREAGWRYRTIGRGTDARHVNVCPAHGDEAECW
jgi:hypothetical protein